MRLAVPVIIGQLGQMMMGVVDSMMVGRVGATPLAAASVAHGLFMIIMGMGFGVTAAISPLTAMAAGRKDHTGCGVVLRQSLLVNHVLSVLLIAVVWFTAPLIRLLDQPPEVAAQAEVYMRILGFSTLPTIIFLTYKQFSDGLEIMRPAMVITILANLVNIAGNWVLIFGNLGAPAMGLAGAGWATLITRVVMATAMAIYIHQHQRYKKYDPSFNYRSINFPVIRKILNLGIPGGIQYTFEIGAFAGATVIIGWLGTVPLAANQIALNLASITFMFAVGIASAGSIRVGNAVGRKNITATRDAGFGAIITAGGMALVFALMFVVGRFVLPTFYIDDTVVIDVAARLLIIAALFQLSDATQAVGIGILRGIADVRIPTLITFFAYWIVGLPVGYLLGFIFELGVDGVWLALMLALTCSGALLTLRFHHHSRKEIHI